MMKRLARHWRILAKKTLWVIYDKTPRHRWLSCWICEKCTHRVEQELRRREKCGAKNHARWNPRKWHQPSRMPRASRVRRGCQSPPQASNAGLPDTGKNDGAHYASPMTPAFATSPPPQPRDDSVSLQHANMLAEKKVRTYQEGGRHFYHVP